MNKNELILDKVRSITTHDLATKALLFRLTSIEEPTLSCTSESEEVTDAIGSVITTLYRAKRATLSGTNSLISLDLAAAQYGTTKNVASSASKIKDYAYEILTVATGETTVSLRHKVKDDVKFIYSIENNEIGTGYQVAASGTADATHFTIDSTGDVSIITVPTGFTGKLFVEYTYETESAVSVVNKASEFPNACSLIVYAYFKDKCNENLTYSGKIICPKAKLNPESIELALTSSGKHAFEFTMMKDYCAEEGEDELFSIIVSED